MSKSAKNGQIEGILVLLVAVIGLFWSFWNKYNYVFFGLWESFMINLDTILIGLAVLLAIPFFIWILMVGFQFYFYLHRYSIIETRKVILSRDDTTDPFEVAKFIDSVNGMLLTRFPLTGWFTGFHHFVWEQGQRSGQKYIHLSAPGPILDQICSSLQSVYQNIRFETIERRKNEPVPKEYLQLRLQRDWIYPLQSLKNYQKSISEAFFASLDNIEEDVKFQVVMTPLSLHRQNKLIKLHDEFEMKYNQEEEGDSGSGLGMGRQKELKASFENRGKGLFKCEVRIVSVSKEARQSVIGSMAEASSENRLIPELLPNWLLRSAMKRFWWRWWMEAAMPSILLGPKVKLSSFHLATLLQLPSMRLRVSGLERSASRRVPLPTGIPDNKADSFMIAENGKPISILEIDRYLNMLFIGLHGSGKTKAMTDYAAPVLKDPEQSSVIVIHDRGDAEAFLDRIPPDKKTYVIDLSRPSDYGLNVLADDGVQADTLSGNLLSSFRTAYGRSAVGDQSGDFLQQSFLALRKVRDTHDRWKRAIPVIDFRHMRDMLVDDDFRESVMNDLPDGSSIKKYWTTQFSNLRESHNTYVNKVAPILNKYNTLLASERVEKILCHPSPLTLRKIIREEKAAIILYTGKNEVGQETSMLMCNMLMSLLFQAISSQADIPQEERVQVNLFLDEMHGYANDALKEILQESRKYGARTTGATLSLSSIEDPNLQKVFKQLFGHKVIFRNNDMDEADAWAKSFAQLYSNFIGLRDEDQDRVRIGTDDILQMKRFHAVCRLTVNGEVKEAFIAQTIKDKENPGWRNHHPWPERKDIQLHEVKIPELTPEEQSKLGVNNKKDETAKKVNPKETKIRELKGISSQIDSETTEVKEENKKEVYPAIGSLSANKVRGIIQDMGIPYLEAKIYLNEFMNAMDGKTTRETDRNLRKFLQSKWDPKDEVEESKSESDVKKEWPKIGTVKPQKVEEIVEKIGISYEKAIPLLLEADKEIQERKAAGETIKSQPEIIRQKLRQPKNESA
ncbi:type IV secretory system conjugative DNA transfer family protein [Mechercharimyces sp. CAU 1602]|uniref:type IV secretory system conjugative DNA transfer family protein n=1 Tax=Mechercharimyces sp. CAU 1602 TaxID=2973933 RepID=UPI002163AD9E|nr:type IV secretory system conjugative DNA transfer family protein [Mechercharimyces sp. CAU 1602]MCS1352827.1 type IV secretory system conjugative DNA transfer family protein [Mechercharimyces sp. CAU 1602]